MTRLSRGLPAEWLVFSVIVVDLVGFGIVIPILPFMSPMLGGDEVDVALVIAKMTNRGSREKTTLLNTIRGLQLLNFWEVAITDDQVLPVGVALSIH